MDTEENVKRYWAFISYSHADKPWADWLHKSLENYPMPRDLIGKPCPADAPIPKRFVPVFRDREELPTATDLGAVIARALRHARFLVVICSPRSAKSQWVEQEIVHYKRMHGEDRVLCLIVDGEPWASDGKPGFGPDDECFPNAVRHRLGTDGELSTVRTEPIAADARDGKDGKENAVIKLMAGLLGVGFDDLRRREQAYQRQRVRRLQITAALFAVLFVAAIVAAVYAVMQKKAVQRTLSQSDLQLSIQARDVDDVSRSAAYLGRSLRSDPENQSAAMAAYASLAWHKQHPPVGPVLRHPGEVKAAFGTADGKSIITSSGDCVYKWSRADHRLLDQASVDGSVVSSLAELPTGEGFVAGTAKGGVHFLGIEDLKPLKKTFETGANGVPVLAWSPTHDLLAVGLAESSNPKKGGGWILLLSKEGVEVSRTKLEHVLPVEIAWSRDGKMVAGAGSSPYFYALSGDLAKPDTREILSKLAVTGLSFTDTGGLRAIDLFTGLSVWDPIAGTVSKKAVSLAPLPSKVSFSPDRATFLGARRGPAAYIYDAVTGEIPTEPISTGFTISDGIWLDDQHILLTSESGLAQVRQVRSAVPAARISSYHNGYPDVLALSADGNVLAASNSSDPLVRFFDTRTLKEMARPLRFPSGIHGMGFLADGRSLGALCWDGRFHRVEWRRALKFDTGEDSLVPAVEDAYGQMEGIRFNPQRTLAAVPVENGVIMIDTAAGRRAVSISIPDGATAVTWSPDGGVLAVATGVQELEYFRPDGRRAPGFTSARLNAPVIHLSWSQAGDRIAALTNSDRVDFFNPVTGNPTAVSFQSGSSSQFVTWISSGKWLLTADMNKVAKLWDPDTGVAVGVLPRFNENLMGVQTLPGRDEVLIAMESGFALVPVPTMNKSPEWLPSFLEAMGGARLSRGKNDPLIDPDAWLASDSAPVGSGGDSVWSPLREWLFDPQPDRAVAAGSSMKESEAKAVLAKFELGDKISAMQKKMSALWKTNEEAKLAEAIDLLDEALRLDPDDTRLQKTRLQIRKALDKPELIRDSNLAIATAGDSTLIEVLDAKANAAEGMLRLESPDEVAARKLVDQVLAENPEHPLAKELAAKLSKK